MKKYIVVLICGIFMFPAVIVAKDGEDSLGLIEPFLFRNYTPRFNTNRIANSVASAPKKTWFKAMRFSGYARFYPYYRNMKSYYDIAPTNGITLPVTVNADDGYQQPLMLFRMEANPSPKVSIQSELQFSNLFKRTTLLTDTAGRYANLYVIFQLQGTVETKIGKLKMIAGGGVNWYRLSPSTLWGYQYRDDLFERYPWEPEGHDFARYNSAYASGDIPRDQRFGKQAMQGFILEGTNMPHGFDAALLYGKTTTSAGFQSYNYKAPQNMFATRIGKMFGDHKMGFNYFNQFGYYDINSNKVIYKPIAQGIDTFYVEENYVSQLVTSLDGRLVFKNFTLFTELGAGSYLSSLYNSGLRANAKTGVANVSKYKRDWDETLFFEIETNKRLTLIPLKVSCYRIGAHVVNNSSSVSNTSVEQAKPNSGVPDAYYTNYYDGMVTDVGQLANNRQGLNISGSKKFNKLTTKFELGIAQEIKNLVGDLRNGARAYVVAGAAADSQTRVPFTNSITFEHKLNGLTRSRFSFYERFTGPNDRLHSVFRRTFENISITDSIVNYKKSFSTFNLELKYKFRFLGKELILSNYNNFSSVQDKWSPIPVFTDNAFLRIFYEELMAFYAIHPKLTMVGFTGMERVIGNKRTELADDKGNIIKDNKGRPIADPNGKAVNQTGYGYGLGLDYNFHSGASLHIRSRWFSHEDKNFVLDKFKGNEMTIEFKVFF